MPVSAPILLWLRRDLRLSDNPALAAAAATGNPLIPVFVDEEEVRYPRRNGVCRRKIGGASSWWRGRSLIALAAAFERCGSKLVLRHGSALDQLLALVEETGARQIHFNRRFEPHDLAQDAAIVNELGSRGIEVLEHEGNHLHEPWALKTLTGDPFRVFTPFWRRLVKSYRPPAKYAAPKSLATPSVWPNSARLADFQVTAPWATRMNDHWEPGEAGAFALMEALRGKLTDYGSHRDRPDIAGTSRLSPHLAWGEISVHDIWRRLADDGNPVENGFLRELGWRDFNTHLLYHFPKLPAENWSPLFNSFPFERSAHHLAAWQKGLTGYPIVDAGMRELWATGWMHNRVRMIAASFLIKDLLTDWREGQAWFWDTLVDADLAQNAGNWQWVAGSGADAAPYFRIFNPTTQGIKFDPNGSYVRRWVPELRQLPTKFIHEPAVAPHADLAAAGIALGRDYPAPIVDHAEARLRALALYRGLEKQQD